MRKFLDGLSREGYSVASSCVNFLSGFMLPSLSPLSQPLNGPLISIGNLLEVLHLPLRCSLNSFWALHNKIIRARMICASFRMRNKAEREDLCLARTAIEISLGTVVVLYPRKYRFWKPRQGLSCISIV